LKDPPITSLLRRWRTGDAEAGNALASALYGELLGMARRQLQRERAGHTLQTTALVHEAWIRLAGSEAAPADRTHFLALAATTMRRVLVDHARKRRAGKRGGEGVRVDLDPSVAAPTDRGIDLIDLHDALEALAAIDPRKARAIELRVFGGLEQSEIALALGTSLATVERDLRMAHAWLRRQLAAAGG
jgi:RNA polymerase sigma factor (TIGR02999 family)